MENLEVLDRKELTKYCDEWKNLNDHIKELTAIKDAESAKIIAVMDKHNLMQVNINEQLQLTLVQGFTKKLKPEAIEYLQERGIMDVYYTVDEKKIMASFPEFIEEVPKKPYVKITTKKGE